MKDQAVIYQGKNGEIKFDVDYVAETIWATNHGVQDYLDKVKKEAK
jgi:hypothetical protein